MTIVTPLGRTFSDIDDNATQHDLNLIRAGVDAKFRHAPCLLFREAVDFDTLKVRLLAVLE